jgi:hypothetical protein
VSPLLLGPAPAPVAAAFSINLPIVVGNRTILSSVASAAWAVPAVGIAQDDQFGVQQFTSQWGVVVPALETISGTAPVAADWGIIAVMGSKQVKISTSIVSAAWGFRTPSFESDAFLPMTSLVGHWASLTVVVDTADNAVIGSPATAAWGVRPPALIGNATPNTTTEVSTWAQPAAGPLVAISPVL